MIKPIYRMLRSLRVAAPVGLTLVLILIGLLPFGAPDLARVMPSMLLIAVYYWSIYRPEFMPAVAVFWLGVLQDAMSGVPLGLSSLVLLGVHGICQSQRRLFLRSTFLVGWWGFLIVAAAASLAVWAISSVYFVKVLDSRPASIQFFLTLMLYPPLALFFGRFERRLLPAR